MPLKVSKFILTLLAAQLFAAQDNNDSTYEIVYANFENNRPAVIPPDVAKDEDHDKKKRKGRKKSENYSEDWTEMRSEDEQGHRDEPPAPPPPSVVKTTNKGSFTNAPTPSKNQASGQTSFVSNRYITVYPTAAVPRLKGDAADSMRQTLLLAAAPVMAFVLAFIM